jgi:hypothetical protein
MRTSAISAAVFFASFSAGAVPFEKGAKVEPVVSTPACGQRGAKACERRLVAPLKSDDSEKTRVPDTARRDEARGGLMI